ncbi:capsular polysaccharide synthesis protein [Cyanothece sp. BG0011]|uniref:capsular polysaccharide synthesis protein n=1 Tax=Cyanothece sp. BG0011 TaxID=2082950 RepID=UPI000D1E155C|nr:capsular polysaccharide synthesis protein [Cyanothece sp. BG0011]
MAIPKKIWFLWFQGLEQAPLVVKKCHQSWSEYNPNWELICLDNNNFKNYVDIMLPEEKFKQLPGAKKANLVRLELLSKYGGVWADATSLCRVPLDSWLEDYTQAGFFAFTYKTRGYGWILNWFLASEPSNPITVSMNQTLTAFYRDNKFYHGGIIAKKRIKFLEKFLNRKYKTTRFWSSWFVRKIFKVYPYFIFHYIFANLINSDRELLKQYQLMKPYPPNGEILGRYGLLRPLTPELKERIDSRIDPVYKLTYKYNQEKYSSSSILYYLLEKTE